MSADTTLTCRDCGQAFTFTSGEQEFYASRVAEARSLRRLPCRAQAVAVAPALLQLLGSGVEAQAVVRARCSVRLLPCGKECGSPISASGDTRYCSGLLPAAGGGKPVRQRSGPGILPRATAAAMCMKDQRRPLEARRDTGGTPTRAARSVLVPLQRSKQRMGAWCSDLPAIERRRGTSGRVAIRRTNWLARVSPGGAEWRAPGPGPVKGKAG